MSAYLATLNARFRVLLQYRAAAIAGLGTQLFWGLIRVMIFEAFYRMAVRAQPMVYDDVVTYIWLGQALLWLLPLQTDSEVRDMVRSGNIVYELLRPVDLYAFWFARGLAGRTAPTLLRSVPQIIIAGSFFGLGAPASWEAAGAFAIALVGAVLLSTAMTVLLTISLLWTVSAEGIGGIAAAATFLFSGLIIPLPFYPDWAQPILDLLPFRGLADVPFRLYLGHLPSSALPGLLLHQLTWTAIFIVLGRYVFARGTRRLVVQGG